MDVPFYPPLARAARLKGTVRWSVATDGQRVAEVKILEGNPLLAEAAEKNVRSWVFFSQTPATFAVLFKFKFAASNAANYSELIKILPDAEIRAELPSKVEITTVPLPKHGDPSPDIK